VGFGADVGFLQLAGIIVIFDIDVVIRLTSVASVEVELSAHIPPQSRQSTVAEVAGAR
jgi:hypothetical protein